MQLISQRDHIGRWRPFLGGDEDRNQRANSQAHRGRIVASLPRRGRGSQPQGRLEGVEAAVVASLPRRGRGSQPCRKVVLDVDRVWRPFLGGDEDRNSVAAAMAVRAVSGVPSSEGTRIATDLALAHASPPCQWRPFLGGDEDRNCDTVTVERVTGTWRPFLGGDEDRNRVFVRVPVDECCVASLPRRGRGSQPNRSPQRRAASTCGVPSSEGTRIATVAFRGDSQDDPGGVPSSEGTRIATTVSRWPVRRRGCGVPSSEGTRIATLSPPVWWLARSAWRPFLGGDEDRNRVRRRRGPPASGGVPSSEGTRIATLGQLGEGRADLLWRPFLGGDEDRNTLSLLPVMHPFEWRPFLGGDEDRNFGMPTSTNGPSGWRPFLGGDEDRNVYDARPFAERREWRPFLGGDEDRNSYRARSDAQACWWRPFLGGDEDRNPLGEVEGEGLHAGGVPSSEGTRIATGRQGELDGPVGEWRPFLGGDEDRNLNDDAARMMLAMRGVPSSEGTRIATCTA